MWPELNGGKGGENQWVQTSAPDAALGRGVKATGYREIDIEYPGCYWAGLQRCDPTGPAYICSLASNGNWWCLLREYVVHRPITREKLRYPNDMIIPRGVGIRWAPV